MWRLFVVLALCGASLVQAGQGVSCKNITIPQNIPLNELQGRWVVRQILNKDDFEISPTESCLTSEISYNSDTGLRIIQRTREEKDGFVMNLKEIGDHTARFSVQEQVAEVLLTSSDLSRYLVMPVCHPSGPQNVNNTSERFVTTVFFLARIQEPGESGNISDEDLAKIIDQTKEDLGLQNYHKKNYNTDC